MRGTPLNRVTRLVRRPCLLAALALSVSFLGVAVLGCVAAAAAAADLGRARDGLRALQAQDVDVERARASVESARQQVARANDRLASPPVVLLAEVPVAGRSFAAERAAGRAAGSALEAVAGVLEVAPDLTAEGGVELSALSELARRLQPLSARAARDLSALEAQPLGATPPPVRDGVGDALAALGPVVDGLVAGADGAQVAASLLGADGARNVLIALQNNAELQGTGGLVSTYAQGVIAGGRLSLQPFGDVLAVNDPPDRARTVPAPPEYVEDYGPFLADTTLWRTWTLSPDVPDAATVASRVAGELLGTTPDVVLLLDVPALAALVGLSGQEVRLPDGSVVGPDELTDALLVDAYSKAGTDVQDQIARRAALAKAAGATVTSLLDGGVEPLDGVRELGRLARGRHLSLWSARGDEQRQLEELDLAGSADPRGDDSLLVSVSNLNANKLDYYIDRQVSLEATVGLDQVDVVQRLVLKNDAPADLVPYVAGAQTPGTARERVELSIAADAVFRALRRDGRPAEGDVRAGQERTRVHTFVELPRGASTTVELAYSVPLQGGRYRLRLLPQPLARDAVLDVRLVPASGLRLRGSGTAGGEYSRSGPWSEQELVEVSAVRRED